jgi:hypothetical protein
MHLDNTLLSMETTYAYFKPTSWSRVLFEKLIAAQLVKEFPAFCGVKSFLFVYIKSLPLVSILRQINSVHTLALYFFKIILNVMLPSTRMFPRKDKIKMAVFWIIAQCSLVYNDTRFKGV